MKTTKLRTRRGVVVNDRMQQGYRYELVRPMGRGLAHDFRPQLTPKQMLRLGVLGGKYMPDCTEEFSADWFERSKLCGERHDPEVNFFKVNASQPPSQWRNKG